MVERKSTRSPTVTTLAAVMGFVLFSGCAMLQPPPMPHFGLRAAFSNSGCTADVSRAHAAFAAAGAAAGDPVATATAHAAAAEAMSSYHTCLARPSGP